MTIHCSDINECLPNNGHGPCQGTCRNLEGGYECSCADIPGYKLAADNHACEDIDECALNNANCSHLCLNTPGSAFCLCPDGFYLTDNWRTCQGIERLTLIQADRLSVARISAVVSLLLYFQFLLMLKSVKSARARDYAKFREIKDLAFYNSGRPTSPL